MTTRSTIFLLGFIICLNVNSFSEDIVLKSGKTYKNIDVFKQEADRLLITHPGGMATIYLKDCPEDIQRKYNYNSSAADTAKTEREKQAQATQEQYYRDQKIWADNQNKQAAIEQQRAAQKKDAAPQLENERSIKAQKPIVACFTSAGDRMMEFDVSAMKRIIECKKAAIIVQAPGRTQTYFVDNSDAMNAIRLFMRLKLGEKGSTAAHRYISCDYLAGLRGPEEPHYIDGHAKVEQIEAQQRTEEQIRNIESKQRWLESETFMMNQYHR